jgi:hypothetical protein
MNIKNLVLATILGICTPIMVNFANNNSVVAQREETSPIGVFQDGILSVSLWYENNTYQYFSYNQSNQNYIQLSGAIIALDSNTERKVFIWNNGNYRYQVAWRPKEPNFVRVIIVNPQNQIITNTILTRQNVYY